MNKLQGIAGDVGRWAAGMRRGAWWADLASPIPRAIGFYARTWVDWVRLRDQGSEMPRVRPHPVVLGEAAVDELLLAIFKLGRPPRHDDAYWRIVEEAADTVTVFERRGFGEDPASYWQAPPPLLEPVSRRRRFGPFLYEHLSWDSRFEPLPEVPGRERWLGYEANRTAHAWVLRHDEPRPWLVCLPGTGMGFPRADFAVFDPERLHRRLGLNVAIPVAPLHGPRRRHTFYGLGFPTDDLVDTVHGATQATWDVRRLLTWIRSQGGGPVGVTGISLGGYLTALLANLDDDLACVIAGVPPVDFAALFEAHTPAAVRDTPLWRALNTVSHNLFRVVSPLALDPVAPYERRYIYAGLVDRLIHPRRQALLLWDHWGRPQIGWYPGCHMGFMWSRPVETFVQRALADSGLVEEDRIGAPAA